MEGHGSTLVLLLLLQAACGGHAEASSGRQWSGEGTNPLLRSIFLGRCSDYITLLSPELRNKNCTAIWEAFRVVLDKDPCSVLPSDYDHFINLSWHAIPRDKSLFWENNHLLVSSFSQSTRRFVPLCDVLYGRVGDFMNWCRQKDATGLDYQSCPTSADCENNPVDSYWKRASVQYSKDSSGVIYVMLNGSDPNGAYPLKGFFADYEIPYFQKDRVTRFEVWVMHEIGGPKVESCGEGSVKILEERLRGMGFQYSCINDYLPVKLLKCVDHSTHPDCVLNSGGGGGGPSSRDRLIETLPKVYWRQYLTWKLKLLFLPRMSTEALKFAPKRQQHLKEQSHLIMKNNVPDL